MKYSLSHKIYFLAIIVNLPLLVHPQESLKTTYSLFQKKPSSERGENAKVVIANIAQMPII